MYRTHTFIARGPYLVANLRAVLVVVTRNQPIRGTDLFGETQTRLRLYRLAWLARRNMITNTNIVNY